MPTTGPIKKVQFCIVLGLALIGTQAGQARAAEQGFSVGDIHRQLTEKTDQHFMLKLNACRMKGGSPVSGEPYPVRIAKEKPQQGATPSPYSKGRLAVM